MFTGIFSCHSGSDPDYRMLVMLMIFYCSIQSIALVASGKTRYSERERGGAIQWVLKLETQQQQQQQQH